MESATIILTLICCCFSLLSTSIFQRYPQDFPVTGRQGIIREAASVLTYPGKTGNPGPQSQGAPTCRSLRMISRSPERVREFRATNLALSFHLLTTLLLPFRRRLGSLLALVFSRLKALLLFLTFSLLSLCASLRTLDDEHIDRTPGSRDESSCNPGSGTSCCARCRSPSSCQNDNPPWTSSGSGGFY